MIYGGILILFFQSVSDRVFSKEFIKGSGRMQLLNITSVIM